MSEPVTEKPATIFWPVTLMIGSLVGWVAFTEFVISVRDQQYAGTEPARIIDVSDMAMPELELKKVPLQAVDMQQHEVRMAAAYPPMTLQPPVPPAAVEPPPAVRLPEPPAPDPARIEPPVPALPEPEPVMLPAPAVMESAHVTPEPAQSMPVSVQRTRGRAAHGTSRRVSPIFQATTF